MVGVRGEESGADKGEVCCESETTIGAGLAARESSFLDGGSTVIYAVLRLF